MASTGWFLLSSGMQARTTELATPTPSACTWHHCTPFQPEPKWSVNPPNDGPWGNNDGGRGYLDDDQNAYTKPWSP
eukprot:CAMPEP_0181288898 /NCGR_PEP_ID=MMETSP1101-20121128/592_1 /TAXON_ID=46948 /ORGANISM="Rhodomonas abbreviata, Strain Caron Lab Isolate" /LENGTH=75 /DNA_ID=CAMNT_0023393079 /DNA_START=15 /DNA_END=242 /DNA_ORIENTATION=+